MEKICWPKMEKNRFLLFHHSPDYKTEAIRSEQLPASLLKLMASSRESSNDCWLWIFVSKKRMVQVQEDQEDQEDQEKVERIHESVWTSFVNGNESSPG